MDNNLILEPTLRKIHLDFDSSNQISIRCNPIGKHAKWHVMKIVPNTATVIRTDKIDFDSSAVAVLRAPSVDRRQLKSNHIHNTVSKVPKYGK